MEGGVHPGQAARSSQGRHIDNRAHSHSLTSSQSHSFKYEHIMFALTKTSDELKPDENLVLMISSGFKFDELCYVIQLV